MLAAFVQLFRRQFPATAKPDAEGDADEKGGVLDAALTTLPALKVMQLCRAQLKLSAN